MFLPLFSPESVAGSLSLEASFLLFLMGFVFSFSISFVSFKYWCFFFVRGFFLTLSVLSQFLSFGFFARKGCWSIVRRTILSFLRSFLALKSFLLFITWVILFSISYRWDLLCGFIRESCRLFVAPGALLRIIFLMASSLSALPQGILPALHRLCYLSILFLILLFFGSITRESWFLSFFPLATSVFFDFVQSFVDPD